MFRQKDTKTTGVTYIRTLFVLDIVNVRFLMGKKTFSIILKQTGQNCGHYVLIPSYLDTILWVKTPNIDINFVTKKET